MRFNSLVFSREKYESDELMWQDVFKCLKIITDNDYVSIVSDDGVCVCIDYNYAEYKEFGNDLPMWLSPEEREEVFNNRLSK